MRKVLKVLKYIVIAIILAIAAFLIYFFASNYLFKGRVNKDNVAYLMKNRLNIGTTLTGELFDSTFFHSDVFLLGEIHGFAENQVLDRKMFIYLNQKLGLKNYITELDSSTASQLNDFLARPTKDLDLLKAVNAQRQRAIPQQAGQQYYDKWSSLYDYNKALPDSGKIKVWGIDRSPQQREQKISRDSAMMANLHTIMQDPAHAGEKYYGLFGFFHVLQSTPQKHDQPFASRLRQHHAGVSSIVSYSLESAMYLPKGNGFPTPDDEAVSIMNADGPLMVVDGISDLQEAAYGQGSTLFKLDGGASPYARSLQLSRIRFNLFGQDIIPAENTESTLRSFQYIFLMNKSAAISALQQP